MKKYSIYGTSEIIEKKMPIAFTFGNFDGVHLGHQALIKQISKTTPDPLVVMTFDPHPAKFLNSKADLKFLTTRDEKVKILLESGVDVVIVQEFTPEFAFLSADDFCKEWLAQTLNIQHIFLGYNLAYGKNRSGNFSHMQEMSKKLNWRFSACAAYEDSPGNIISSTRIRDALTAGEPKLASSLLGRPYRISGTVFKGDQRGRQLGFPTANIAFDPSIVIPHYGVYVCEVEFPDKHPNQKFLGVMNCGVRPTIQSTIPKVQIEAHILNFDEDVYNEKVIFHIVHFIRKEQKFGSLDKLKEQMEKDVSFTQSYT